MPTNDRYPVTQKYLVTRAQALSFPASYFKNMNLGRNTVFGIVMDIPMPGSVLTTMVCFINGAANLYFNNGNEYTGASQKYRNLVQAAHNLVRNSTPLIQKAEKVTSFDLPKGRTQNVYLLTKGGIYKVAIRPGVIPAEETELRTFYVLQQRVMNELRSCQLKDDMLRRNGSQ